MTSARPRPLVAGNWKMNGNKLSARVFAAIIQGYDAALRSKVELLICPPATLTVTFGVVAVGSGVSVGGQDCHVKASGAHTGDVSAPQLADAGASYVIVGHSERRADHGETDAVVRAKALAARDAWLTPVVCVGETRGQREGGNALDVVRAQLAGSLPETANGDDLVVAYEPVWAIGTGLTPTPAQVAEVHAAIRAALVERYGEAGAAIRILYGGSVKPDNAFDLLSVSHVDGALVGGASLEAADFLAIADYYR
ncbi:triosephosphate isomerase [Pseudochelatococcus lubricantis]|uniref:Triosephosphate isomerase n=1 Tax=Pseudochelatococcus lubricantis TaxID=1538102 RepID=A0ABX0V103_9HYPH|nr:triose-phosphate isomerase [Pseudochelatococcus lubricantis]NIJ56781.1 triosephosphate isomerase [Pseudochelatococcus lubricantis]